jgi:hypothetical protein
VHFLTKYKKTVREYDPVQQIIYSCVKLIYGVQRMITQHFIIIIAKTKITLKIYFSNEISDN